MNNQKKVLTIILSIIGGIVLLGAGILLCIRIFGSNFSLRNTTWIENSGSEMVFTSKTVNWYKTEGKHDDNYYSGTYKKYVGKAAVNYITTELASYNVTKEELQTLFDNSEVYDESNFIVLDVNYEYTIIGGEKNTPTNPRTPYFGFILSDGEELYIANMNTGSYLNFTKKK